MIETRSPLTFSSNFDLWWAAFRYNGEKLEEITKTIDHSLHPQDTFKLPHGMGDLYAAQPHGMGDLYAAQTVCVSFHSSPGDGACGSLPQNENSYAIKLEENIVASADADMEIESKNKVQCVFIVACADWGELEKYNKIEYAEKELLESGIKETTGETLRGYSKVIIKLCFPSIYYYIRYFPVFQHFFLFFTRYSLRPAKGPLPNKDNCPG